MIKLEITQADIDKAYEVTDKLPAPGIDWYNNCPAAQALKRLYPGMKISVGFSFFTIGPNTAYCTESSSWIYEATDARTIKHLRPSIKPITFELR